ncbi:MAG TPA: enoyl-CoA hydratase-related protein [Gammaproteobacteria bacterium]|nr:enoyl-CoA hydratase-related protein [Gammaproteobacteria bacterium]
MAEVVLTQARGQAVQITINRPDRHNAINEALCAGLAAAIDAAEADRTVRAIVLTGAGDRVFCAGGDLKPSDDGSPFALEPAEPNHYVIKLFRRLQACRLPILARINGNATAGGLGLVCACDLAVASATARFGVPETRVGLFPMMILPYMLRVIPRRRLLEMCITGELFDAEEALALDIVNYVVPPAELDAKIDWLLARIVDKSPTAIRIGKQVFHAIEDMSLDQAFELTQVVLPIMAQSEDAKEGFAAFNAKRPPRFTGK